jgi:hypothetical protein
MTYLVVAARRVDGRLVPGVSAPPVTVTAVDRTAPAPPAGLDFTQSLLTWQPSPELDLGGYRVYRSDRPNAGFQPITPAPIRATIYSDPGYRQGLYYAVSAVDDSGNESAISAAFRAP